MIAALAFLWGGCVGLFLGFALGWWNRGRPERERWIQDASADTPDFTPSNVVRLTPVRYDEHTDHERSGR